MFNSKSNLNQHLNKKYKCFTYDNNTQSSSTNASYLSNEEIEILKNKLNKTTIMNNNLKNENIRLKLKLSKIYDVIIEKHDKHLKTNKLISNTQIDEKDENDENDENDTKTDISPSKTCTTDTLSTITQADGNELPKNWFKSKSNKTTTI